MTDETEETEGTEREHGRVSVEPRVVQKIAALAAAESDDVLRRRSLRGSNERGVQAVADIDGDSARITVTVSVRYPCDLRAVVKGIRERVTRNVKDQANVKVRGVHIQVVDFVRTGER